MGSYISIGEAIIISAASLLGYAVVNAFYQVYIKPLFRK